MLSIHNMFVVLIVIGVIYLLGCVIYWICMRDVLSSHSSTFPSKWAWPIFVGVCLYSIMCRFVEKLKSI